MKNTTLAMSQELRIIPKTDNQIRIDNHKKAATHFESAAKSHHEAAHHHGNENNDKASKSSIEAKVHSRLGNDAQKKM